MRIALIGSSGGHLRHLQLLRDWWRLHDRFWVTFDKPDASALLTEERVYWCYYPTNRNIFNLFRNSLLALKVLWKEKPTVIVSSGAAVAIPFFYMGKCLGAKTVYIEVYDRIDSPTLSGRLVYPVTDHFFVQWPEQLRYYPNASVIGELF
jgi:beta-1,4-N-acetylglucosaminyltransferase